MSNLRSYEEFVDATRVRTNQMLNRILWYFLAVGPAVTLGIRVGLFKEIEYQSCLVVTCIILVLAFMHLMLCKRLPNSSLTSYFALVSLDVLLVYMVNSHLGIYLTYCLVPTLSLLFCDRKVFLVATGINLVAMGAGTYMVSPFFASHSTLYPISMDWFINIFGGYVVEAFVMFLAGSTACRFATGQLEKLYENQHELKKKEIQISDQLDILKSMSEIYQILNLVDLENGVVSAMNELDKVEKLSLGSETRSWSNRKILETVLFEYRDAFASFSDLSTLRERIKGKKSITLEIQDAVSGWLRCQYISLSENVNGEVDKVVYTVESVVEEKRREERLIRISNTDELTGLYNRRSFESEVKKLEAEGLDYNFVIFSIDINGLKEANDALGHDAGDELIHGAAYSLLKVFGSIGKIYRVGGDEFIVLLSRLGDIADIKQRLLRTAAKWSGDKVRNLDFSVGYACRYDNPNASFDELEREADKMMYRDKEIFYSQRGMDRRGVQSAYTAVCDSYEKILKINLEQDAFKVVKMNESERRNASGYSDKFSEWCRNFGNLGFVHPGDLQEYLLLTDIGFLMKYFSVGENGDRSRSLKIFYHRKYGEKFCRTLMEIVVAEKSENLNEFFLYVKNIDR